MDDEETENVLLLSQFQNSFYELNELSKNFLQLIIAKYKINACTILIFGKKSLSSILLNH